MNAVEKLIAQGLEGDPSDISIRLELAEKLAARGAIDELAEVISSAPGAPDSSADMHRFLELAAQSGIGDDVANGFIAKYVAGSPADSWGHYVYALGLSRVGKTDSARRHFEAACKLDPSLSDPSLEEALKPVAEPAKVVEVAKPKPVEAAEPAKSAEPAEPAEAEAAEPAEAEAAEAAEAAAVPVARSLRPQTKAAADAGAEPGAQKADTAPAPAPQEAHEEVAAPSGKVLVTAAADHEGHDDQGEHHERSLVLAEGEMVHAHAKDPDTKQKIEALTVAVLVHVALIIAVAFLVIAMPVKDPPLIVGNQLANLDETNIDTQVVEKKVKQAPVQSASAQVQVMTVTGASSVSMPEITTDLDSFDPIGIGDSLGMSMSFDAGEDGGMVSFFGARTMSKKVVFVVDFSLSMKASNKDDLMRKELAKSIEALPAGVEYQLILFSGPAWFAGDKEMVKDDKDLPKGRFITASQSALRKTLETIKETPLSGGTEWTKPLKMAMNMRPDTIFFMTDGAVKAQGMTNKEMVEELLKYNNESSKAKINTICMMVLKAREELEGLAEGSGGEFSLVEEDGKVLRGRDLDRMK